MSDLTSLTSHGPPATGYIAPTPAAAPTPAPAPAGAPQAAGQTAATTDATPVGANSTRPTTPAGAGKGDHPEVTSGFNPSMTIDSDTHILVMTIRAPDGSVLRQMPNQHELAAYKASATEKKQEG